MVKELTDQDFQTEVLDAPQPSVILFTAGWCTFCDDMIPRLEELEPEYEGRVRFFVANSDQQKGLRISFAVAAVPYLVMVDGQTQIPLFDEIVTTDRLRERIDKVLMGETPNARPLKLRLL